ncbi:uncharacterized protein L201_003360 [Kwoniella dendrophila CBS 6074]|uniref:isoleucine--tRNA ligase n=1 Tax=Kwoniella dendrophila CBS 6074 TaxID=1295534 RepID=A0AAX4JUH1_9TREE
MWWQWRRGIGIGHRINCTKNKEDNPLFVLHDGPPYANGNLHMGHALNKVLKDIINRYNLIRGKRVHYVPGWDCHGLPIEHKALAAIGKSHTSLTPGQVRNEARKVALEAIGIQKNEMRALGVMADWDGEKGIYRTLGHITHRLRPTYYSPSSRTALAEAELSYKDGHKSRSVYVGFPVALEDMSEGLREVYQRECGGKGKLELAIWTTTPWTLPANMVRSQLVGTQYTHLFHPTSSSQSKPSIMAAKHVTAQAGTGLVHSAPAHGHEDYEAFIAAGMLPEELRCPVDDDGRFTPDLTYWTEGDLATSLVGQEVLGKGTHMMVDLLRDNAVLLAEQDIEHRYPYDWKSKKPIIVRATPQWFADVEGVKPAALEAMENVNFHPAIYGPIMDAETLDHILSVLDSKGIDHWWEGPVEDFIPTHLKGQDIRRTFDTLDVWFDSGSSWTMLEDLSRQPLADVYLEGSDQHRGWFQSSMLTKLVSSSTSVAPYGTNFTPRGADILRLWAASVDYTNDVSIGPTSISNATESMRKLRNTLRFLLANIGGEPSELNNASLRLILQRMTRILAPITPHLAEEIYEHMGGREISIFLDCWNPETSWLDATVKSDMTKILSLRAEVQKLVEQARAEKRLKTSSQAKVYLSQIIGTDAQSLSALLGVSSVELLESSPVVQSLEWQYDSSLELDSKSVSLVLGAATDLQCPRCWLYTSEESETLCSRCEQVVQ